LAVDVKDPFRDRPVCEDGRDVDPAVEEVRRFDPEAVVSARVDAEELSPVGALAREP
jgi:hypothetical protein